MARTPAPADMKTLSFQLSAENDEYLTKLQQSLSRNSTDTMARELDFLRLWGLSSWWALRLQQAATRAGATVFQYVTGLLSAKAAELPTPPQIPPEAPPSNEKVRGNLNFNGVAQALVLGYAASRGLSFSMALDELLTFARTYNLTRGQYAALEAHATARGVGTIRDVVLETIANHVAQLPDPGVAEPAPLPIRRRRK